MSCSLRSRICAKCNRSLFLAPAEPYIHHKLLQQHYSEFLCLLEEEERFNVIVSIYDIENPCHHHFHLLCLCLHRAYYLNVLGVPSWQKLPCPAIECPAFYSDWCTLNFIPYKQFQAQYKSQNPNWNFITEFQP